jgi:alkylation response protein AidB-like acyl-CoA dehydrogenase
MDFDFSPEQYMLRDTVRDLLRRECTPAEVRAAWASPTGRSQERWRKLAELGVVGLTIPEEHGGAGMDEVDLVLVLEEAGRSLLPEPLLETTAVGAPLLARAGSDALRSRWLPRIASGEAGVTVGLAGSPYVADATADLVILEREGALHAVTQDRLTLQPLRSMDGARRLFAVTAELGDDTVLSTSPEDARWAFDHAAAATAAELVGVAGAMLDMTVGYVKQREQFGRKIGSFQAVQHKLAETLMLVESARAAVYYAAWALATDAPDASIAASVAKAYASDAERRANAEALQLHGGIGFTWEHDLHLWLKRGKALELQHGDADLHRRRISDWIYAPA